MTPHTIFLTGATGFIGSCLTLALAKKGHALKLLVRDKGGAARDRLEQSMRYLFDRPEDYAVVKERCEVIQGDIAAPGLGIAPAVTERLKAEVDLVLHNAALTTFDESVRHELQRYNVDGTRNMLDFTLGLDTKNFHYVSTAYVCGQESERFGEEDLDIGQVFNNPYEESKFSAEKLVHAYGTTHALNTVIYRPSIVVGDSTTGRAISFLGAYSFIKAVCFLAELFGDDLKKGGRRAAAAGVSYNDGTLNIPFRIPADPHKTLNIVPVDYVVEGIAALLERRPSAGATYHLTNPSPPTMGELAAGICALLGVSGLPIVEPAAFDRAPMTEWEQFFIGSIREVTPYLLRKEPLFSDTHTRRALEGTGIRCPRLTGEILGTLIAYYRSTLKLKK